MTVTRREILLGSIAAGTLWGKGGKGIGHAQISAISDEIARSPEAAIAFAHQYGMRWLELRDVPGDKGKNYFLNDEAYLRAAAKQFADGGVKISFLNTNLLKFGLPGTEPLRRTPEAEDVKAKRIAREQARFEQREGDLRKCIQAAHILGCKYLRIFTFSRVAEPESTFPRMAEILDSFARVAEKEGVVLLVENESSCNVGTCAELASLLKRVPSKAVGINWDADNGQTLKERPLEDGYPLLPKKRIYNVQVKGRTILDYPQKLDWPAIFDALAKDGFTGNVGLETHIFGAEQVARSHDSMRAILKIVDPEFQPKQQESSG